MRRCWVVKDKYGEFEIHRSKPVKDVEAGCWWSKNNDWYFCIPEGFLPLGIYPQWEDEEPTEIEIAIKLAEKEDEKV